MTERWRKLELGHVVRRAVHTVHVCILNIYSHTCAPSASTLNANELFLYIFRDCGINRQHDGAVVSVALQ